MDLFSQIVEDFSLSSHVESWDETQVIFRRVASGRPGHWLMPVRACEAVGGLPERAIAAMLAVGCAHVGILLVDDMLDADPRGEYHRVGMPAASNLACTFQAAALEAVGRCAADVSARLAALTSFNEMFLSTAYGQHLDVQAPADEDSYWRTAQTKSSPFFGAALQVGALAGGGTLETAGRLNELGRLYGEMVQIHDDLHDVMEMPANPDWVQGRSPLPILFAALVEHPEQARFLELKKQVDKPAALQEAQEILLRCGAVSYCVYHLTQRYEKAQEIMKSISLARPESVASLLDDIIAPVHKLLETLEDE